MPFNIPGFQMLASPLWRRRRRKQARPSRANLSGSECTYPPGREGNSPGIYWASMHSLYIAFIHILVTLLDDDISPFSGGVHYS